MLAIGFSIATVLYGAYWIQLRIKLSKLERVAERPE